MATPSSSALPKPFAGRRTHAFLLALACFVPACAAVLHVSSVADAAHDDGTIRAVGLGWTGAWRALDAVIAAPFVALPIGTRSARAALACAVIAGVAGGVLYALGRRLLAACASGPRLPAILAAIASITATIGATWQLEAASPGGSVLGALLVLAPSATLLGDGDVRARRVPIVAALLGAAASYEPLVGACAFVSASALALVEWRRTRAWLGGVDRRMALVALAAFAAGATPLAVGLVRAQAARSLVLGVPALTAWAGEPGASWPISPMDLVGAELGWPLFALALGGALFAMIAPRARPEAIALVVVAIAGVASTRFGVPGGPTRFGGPVLAAIGASFLLAAVALQALVRAVASARVPFAKASAAMVVLLALTFPVHFADDAIARTAERARGQATTWDDVAWGALPAGSVLMVSDVRVSRRIVASRAAGVLRGDLAVVPTYDLDGPAARRELAHEPKLAPFWRDMAIATLPEEFSLSSLAASRPLALVYDARWEHGLARHLVPLGLVARFEPEPRGASDRRRALDGFAPKRDRLARATINERDIELIQLTAVLLRARAIALAATGDKDLVARGIDDVHVFAPEDPVAAVIAARAAQKKGAVDVKGLAP